MNKKRSETEKGGVDEKRDCGNSGYTVSHHSSTVLKQHKAARHAAAGSSSKASSMMTAWERYLGLHSQPSNTALWGTQQTGLAFQAQAAALRDDWITVQSSRTNTMAFTEVWQERWRFRRQSPRLFQSCILWISSQCLLKKYHYLKE